MERFVLMCSVAMAAVIAGLIGYWAEASGAHKPLAQQQNIIKARADQLSYLAEMLGSFQGIKVAKTELPSFEEAKFFRSVQPLHSASTSDRSINLAQLIEEYRQDAVRRLAAAHGNINDAEIDKLMDGYPNVRFLRGMRRALVRVDKIVEKANELTTVSDAQRLEQELEKERLQVAEQLGVDPGFLQTIGSR